MLESGCHVPGRADSAIAVIVAQNIDLDIDLDIALKIALKIARGIAPGTAGHGVGSRA